MAVRRTAQQLRAPFVTDDHGRVETTPNHWLLNNTRRQIVFHDDNRATTGTSVFILRTHTNVRTVISERVRQLLLYTILVYKKLMRSFRLISLL